MKVRLLLVETGIWRFMPELVNGIARTYTGNETPLGLVHAGLQIGPYYVGNVPSEFLLNSQIGLRMTSLFLTS